MLIYNASTDCAPVQSADLDNAGNILTKKTYALTATGVTPTNPTDEEAYTYGNVSWGDLLTAYNGNTNTIKVETVK